MKTLNPKINLTGNKKGLIDSTPASPLICIIFNTNGALK